MHQLVSNDSWAKTQSAVRACIGLLEALCRILTWGWICPAFSKTFDAYCENRRKVLEQVHKETNQAAFGTCGCGCMWRSFYSYAQQRYYRSCARCGAEVKSRSRYDIPGLWSELMENRRGLYAARSQ